jgi:hypothetical protein
MMPVIKPFSTPCKIVESSVAVASPTRNQPGPAVRSGNPPGHVRTAHRPRRTSGRRIGLISPGRRRPTMKRRSSARNIPGCAATTIMPRRWSTDASGLDLASPAAEQWSALPRAFIVFGQGWRPSPQRPGTGPRKLTALTRGSYVDSLGLRPRRGARLIGGVVARLRLRPHQPPPASSSCHACTPALAAWQGCRTCACIPPTIEGAQAAIAH